jgi:hypothetical protein
MERRTDVGASGFVGANRGLFDEASGAAQAADGTSDA